MRKQMMASVAKVIEEEPRTCLLLADIGVWGFHETLEKYPGRAMNIGIFEDGMVSVAAGMALGGMIPIVYGISPFIVDRAFEQLKLDFAYQKCGGNFLTTGAAYDFSTLGYSHYCHEDIGVLKMAPGLEFLAPGTAEEFKLLFESVYDNGNPSYFRLSDYVNQNAVDVVFGKAAVIQEGRKATVIAVSTMLDAVMEACQEEDVTILYYTTLQPFDMDAVRKYSGHGKILLCEPHFEGSLSYEVMKAMEGKAVRMEYVGMPLEILRTYGSKQEKDIKLGLHAAMIREKLDTLIG